MFARVSFVAVILIGFGDTGGGIFLPVIGSSRTGVDLEDIVICKRMRDHSSDTMRGIVLLARCSESHSVSAGN